MGVDNWSAAVAVLLLAICLGGYLFAIRRQFVEVLVPRDSLTQFRWYILGSLITTIVGIMPVMAYQALRMVGIESELLRNIANITGNISRLAGMVLIVLIYTYKKKKQ